jgi:hypothetical protein
MAGVQKPKIQWAISLLLVKLYFYGMPVQAQYGGGSGTAENPFLIFTAEQINAIGANQGDWDKHFRLMADIDLSNYKGTDFNIIGYFVGLNSPENKPFTGVFDGNGKKILNFSYTSKGVSNIGLFGYVDDPNAQIIELGLINPNIDIDIDTGTEEPVGSKCVGSLVGYFWSGTITNCYGQAAGWWERIIAAQSPTAIQTAAFQVQLMSAGWWEAIMA